MRTKKLMAFILAAAVAASMTACGSEKTSEETNSAEDSTTTAASENTTTSSAATEKAEASVSDNKSNTDSVMVYYGWGSAENEAKYTAEIFCPEGAKFSENTLKIYEEDGSVMTVEVDDEVNEYSATSSMHWHRDAYSSEPTAYPIIAQLYFDGELDAETAAENSNCSQNVTPLGFKWNGYDVILIETKYTFKDYGETTELFAGVEYDLDYWKAEEGTGEVKDLTTKALFGFDMYSYGWDELTQDKCAWIAGELFGVDSGVANPFTSNGEETTEAVVNVDNSALVGKWIDNESDWEDTYIFNTDGTGVFISGPEYEFTYSVDGDTLTLVYAEDDTESHTVTLDGNKIILKNKFGTETTYEKVEEASVTEPETEEKETEDESPYAKELIGTWTDLATGIDETFTFKAGGNGDYSCLNGNETYECTFTYEFVRDDCIELLYSDGDASTFIISIDGNELSMAGYVYTKQ